MASRHLGACMSCYARPDAQHDTDGMTAHTAADGAELQTIDTQPGMLTFHSPLVAIATASLVATTCMHASILSLCMHHVIPVMLVQHTGAFSPSGGHRLGSL